MNDLFDNFGRIEKNDPEFYEIFKNFAFDEVLEFSSLNENESVLVILASLIACQSPKAFKKILSSALDNYVTPREVKELLYQSKVFDKKGIKMPLDIIPDVAAENKYKSGREIQETYFGVELIKLMDDSTLEGQQHINKFLESHCFGDFYTREGLNDKQRELITFTFITTLGGCENQLRGHIQGNLSVGNDKERLISAITVMLPYIGFPRSLNAISIVNEICE